MMKIAFIIAFIFTSLSLNAQISQSKKEKKIYPMGKKVFEKKCKQNIDIQKYKNMDELSSDIKSNNLCKPLKDKHLESLVLYLWEVKRLNGSLVREVIKVAKGEKCPVCGMFVYKYPKWAAQIFYEDKHLSFDGVKDMMKFYFNPKFSANSDLQKEDFTKILVTDYYTQEAINAKNAYYVIGSDIYGPMGDELIPFKNKKDAQSFSDDHEGKMIIHFNDISQSQVYGLDE